MDQQVNPSKNEHILCPHCGKGVKLYKNPLLTVDVIIEVGDGVVLIERKNRPYGWALPGGFVDYGESLEAAARREAFEETGLVVRLDRQLHTYSDPARDPRHHTITTVYIGTGEGEPRGADDARQAKIFFEGDLPPLVFDHEKILDDYYRYRRASRPEKKDPRC